MRKHVLCAPIVDLCGRGGAHTFYCTERCWSLMHNRTFYSCGDFRQAAFPYYYEEVHYVLFPSQPSKIDQ